MKLSLVTGPAEPLFSIEEARAHCRIDALTETGAHEDDDLIMNLYLPAAIGELDGANGWLGRALVTQTWKLTLAGFPLAHGAIPMPLPPLQSVSEISYVATDGTATVLDDAEYRVITDGTPGLVMPVYGKCWPSTRCQPDAVSITFVAGFGDPEDVPPLIRQYVAYRLGMFYATREAVVIGAPVAELPWVSSSLESLRYRGGRQ